MNLLQQMQRIKLTNNPNTKHIDQLLISMLASIGSNNSEMRESIYTSFEIIIKNDYLNNKQLMHLLKTCLGHDFMFYRIGENNTDSVFTRSFSVLVMTEIIKKDYERLILSSKTNTEIINLGIDYMNKEIDTRGYVENKGWAHSIAHGADFLLSCIEHPHFLQSNTSKILDTIKNCLFKHYVYIDDEDKRLILVIEALLYKNLNLITLESWINEILEDLKQMSSNTQNSLSFYTAKTNVTNFLKSIYFRLDKDKYNEVKLNIEEGVNLWFI